MSDRYTITLDANSAKFQNALTNAQNRLQNFSTKSVQYLNNIERAANSINKNTNFMFFSNLGGGLNSGITALGKYADSYQELGNKLRLVESAGIEGARGLQSIFDISLQTNQSIQSTSDVYQRFAQNAKTLGINQAQVASLTETVAKAVAVSGASAASAQAALMQFGQSLASGVFRGQEFNSVMEQTPGLAQAIARGLGVTIGELRKMANDGKLTMDVLIPALEKAKASVDEQFSTRIVTISQAFENLKTNTTKWVGEVDQSINASRTFVSAIDAVAEHLTVFATVGATASAAFTVGKIKNFIQAGNEQAAMAIKAAQAEKLRTAAIREQQAAEMSLLQVNLTHARTDAERLAIKKLITTQEAKLTTVIAAEAAAQRNLAVAQKSATAGGRLLSEALGLLGGPIGAVSVAASVGIGLWLDYAQKTEEAHQKALAFANDLSALTAELEKMNVVQLGGKKAEAEESLIAQQQEVKKLEQNIKDLETQIRNTPKLKIVTDDSGYQIEIDNSAKIAQLTRDLAKAKAELDTQQAKLNETQAAAEKITSQLAITSQNELDSALSNLRTTIWGVDIDTGKFNGSMLVVGNTAGNVQSPLSGMIERLLSSGNAAREGAKGLYEFANAANAAAGGSVKFPYRLDSTTVQADDKQQAFLKQLRTQNKINNAKTKEEYVSLNVKQDLEKQGIGANSSIYSTAYAELTQKYGEQWDKLQKKASKAGENARDNWLKFYDEIRQKNSSSLGEIDLEQARMFQRLEEYMRKGVVSHTEYETAKTAITERFAKQRLELTGKYAPEKLLAANLKEDLAAIAELSKSGLLNQDEAKLAAQRMQFDYAQQKSQNTVSPLDQMRALYDPNQELLNHQTQELAQLQGFYDQKLMAEEEFQQRKHQIIDRYKNKQFQTEMAQYVTGLSDLGSAFDNLTSVIETSAGKQSAAYKAMFAVSKAFAIAEATVKLSQAIAQAMADTTALTPAQKFANMAAVAAAGANVISQIGSVSFATGGYTGDGGKYQPAGVVHRGEYVITKEATSRLGRGYLDYLNYGSRRGFANGGGVAVPTVPTTYTNVGNGNKISVRVINNGEPVNANVSRQQQGNELEITVELLKRMDQIADQRYRKNQINDMRSGGALSR